MRVVELDQVLPFEQWERVRPLLRPLFIREKKRRRLLIDDHLTLLFENAQSVWYQVEEMLRVERITESDAIEHEIQTYNELIPREDELSATLLIGYPDAAERTHALKALVGLDRCIRLVADSRGIPAIFAESQLAQDAVSSVQFVRFSLPRGIGERFIELAKNGQLAIEVDHPALSVKAQISEELAQALYEDLIAT